MYVYTNTDIYRYRYMCLYLNITYAALTWHPKASARSEYLYLEAWGLSWAHSWSLVRVLLSSLERALSCNWDSPGG
jgi:uncharacterized protein YchJ